MGAAVGKAAQYIAGGPEAHQAAARLAFAENAVLQWNRSAAAGIWDADANHTNTVLLSAVDELLRLAQEAGDPFPSSARRRDLDVAVAVAGSRMVEEFLRVRVWNASQLRFAVDRLSLASSGASAATTTFPGSSGDDRTNISASTGASDGSNQPRITSWSVPDEVVAVVDGEFFMDELDLVCPAGVAVLHEIAQRVVRAECSKEFIRAFANAPCDVLDSFLSILRVECSQRTTEVVIKRWSAVAKIVARAVLAMRRQLCAQNHSGGAFDGFRDEYLSTIAESRVLVLLQFADEFTRLTLHEKLVHILSMYDALSDAAPGFLLLFSGARRQRVAERTQGILARLADVVRTMVAGLVAKIRSDSSSHTPSAAVGVHPLTRYAMTRVAQLAPHRHRTVLGLIFASGGVEGVASFGGLVTELIVCLERNLEAKSALIRADDAGGSAHLFLANNVRFVLNRVADADLLSLLGDEWAAWRRSQLERHAAVYVEACWGPVVACLGTANGCKPARALAKFNEAFKKAHGTQVCREVPDPALRAALRKTVSEKVVPAYVAFLQEHPKLQKSVRYSADDLTESLSDLFEGEATDGLKP